MDKDLEEIKNAINNMDRTLAVVKNNSERQANTIDKLSEAFDKLSIFIEKTNENNRKIDKLFEITDDIKEHGTKNCPVNVEKLNSMQKRIDILNKIVISELLFLAAQFVFLLIFLIEKKVI